MANGGLTASNSPLTHEQAERASQLVADLGNDQITWLSGYLAGLTAAGTAGVPAASGAAAAPAEAPELAIVFGSQTGNAEQVATQAATQAEARGFRAQVIDMADLKKAQLKAAGRLLVIVSTHGEGEPPDNALEVHELVHSKKAPPLKELEFSVLALGDTSYEHFCQTGRDFDARLEALGGTRIHPRTDCDVDFDDAAEAWIEGSIEAFAAKLDAPPSNVVAFGPVGGGEPAPAAYSKKNPFQASLLDNVVLNGAGSEKETRHIEVSLEDSGLEWQPGDSLGVLPQNNPREVEAVLAALGFAGDASVTGPRGDVALAEALAHDYEITTLTRPFLQSWAELSDADELRAMLADERREELREWMYGRHIVDVLETWPAADLTPQGLIELLRKLPARLYSIASSYKANPDEVHLTVAAVRYEAHGREREGVASTWLADRVGDDTAVPVYIDTNKNFRLPDDDNAPIVMIGPGTGVAPFRAFVEEREQRGASGSNWLFFGEQRFHDDFLYQREWLRWREQGILDRVDVAFSRDQAEKVYVQDRLRARGAELYAWLQDGAYVYVCGDAERMAPDVHQALIDVIAEHGERSPEDAAAWLGQLRKDKRYQRDVY
jgi:sulfite reductase (NADPH) flavoprotein alpha-component